MADLQATDALVRERYEGYLAEHGAGSAQAVGWHDVDWQVLRFQVLAQVMEGEEPVSVADFGCGTGALFAHLAARPDPPPLGAYAGYDLVPAFVDAARAEHTDPRARFEVASEVADEADYVFASGAFSLCPGLSDEQWEEQVRGRLRRLWARSRRGLAFNLLIRTARPRDDGFYAGVPDAWANWCQRELDGALVALTYGPPLPDFTVLMRRARSTG
jgi:SAM-dependent methyltransferase